MEKEPVIENMLIDNKLEMDDGVNWKQADEEHHQTLAVFLWSHNRNVFWTEKIVLLLDFSNIAVQVLGQHHGFTFLLLFQERCNVI